MKTNYKKLFSKWAIVALLPAFMGLTSCSEDIDESNLYTFTGETIEDYLANREEFENFNYILQRVGLDKLLSTYGTYTCFAPKNEAVIEYIDSLYNTTNQDGVEHNGMTQPGLEGLTDSLCNDIAKFHLVNLKFMAVDMGKNITITSMLGREMNTSTDPVTGNTVVNSLSQITSIDNELENGVLHEIDHVLTRSNNKVYGEMVKYEYFQSFVKALEVTGLADSLDQRKKDATYGVDMTYNFYVPTECAIGYTLFVETDDVLAKAGIDTAAVRRGDLTTMADYARRVYEHSADPGSGWYDYAMQNNIQVSTGTDYDNPWNVLNMFIRYHIVKYKIPYDRLVFTGLNEVSGAGYYEYNETMLPYTLLKVSAESANDYRYVNMWYENSTLNENDSLNVDQPSRHNVLREGARILLDNEYQQPINGYIHRINKMLVYDEDVPHGVLNERMRFDDTAFLPEMMSNGFRGATDAYIRTLNGGISGQDDEAKLGGDYIRFPANYFEYLRIYNGNNTRLYYLPGRANGWNNYQKDEFNCAGAYDFAFRLPPVPAGTYELRMGYTANGNRGMMQVFIGRTPDVTKMKAADIPIDMRNVPSASDNNNKANIATGWRLWTQESDKGVQTDKDMHNLGWMRGPLYYGTSAENPSRTNVQGLRRIVAKQQFEQGDYWVRFKTCLPENTGTQFHLDFIELVPSTVYNHPTMLEDMY